MKRLLPLLLCAVAFGALAESKPNRDQEQLRRLRAQAQQLQQSLDAEQQQRLKASAALAEAEKIGTALQERAGAAQRRAAGAEKQLGAARQELDALRQERDQMKAQLDSTRASLGESERKAGHLAETLVQKDRELVQTREQLGAQVQDLKQRNAALYALGIEAIEHYRHRSMGARIGQAEPFMQTGRVQMEMLLEGYRDRLEDGRAPAALSSR